VLAAVLSMVAALVNVGLAAQASAGTPRCFGERATIVGTSHAEVLNGTRRADVIVGLGGGDTIRGRGRGDLICAGKGNDTILGGNGIDLIFGEGGSDEIRGQRGAFNQAVPGPGNDLVDGGPAEGDEVIYLDASGPIVGDLGAGTVAGWGNDEIVNTEWLIGSSFDDTLTGSEGSDLLFGADGNDTLEALGGDDFPTGGAGDDAIDGGDGFDFLVDLFLSVYYFGTPPEGPFTVDLSAGTFTGFGSDTLVGIEASQGSTGDDVMIGTNGDNEFTTLVEGDDTVDGGGGDDLVDGGDGIDDLDGGSGIDMLGNLDATAGMTINLSTSTDSQGDTLAGFEDLVGTFFDDSLTGNDGPNEIEAADGNDQLFGLGGDDLLVGDFPDVSDAGTDSADGGLGTDACDAETEVNCETDPPALTSIASTSRGAYRFGAVGFVHWRASRVTF
jgi:Ca2+-binding RTX toxin-like protein